MRIITTTVVGSHMWGANHPGSDTDKFNIFVAPTRAILRGEATELVKSYEDKTDPKVDAVFHEVGHTIDLLLAGNINFVFGVMSPVVEFAEAEPPFYYKALREIVATRTGKNIYHSTMGLVKFLDKDITKADDEYHANKKRRIGVRSARFVAQYLETGEFVFMPMPSDTIVTQELYESAKVDLQKAYDESELNEKPDPKPYRDWLEHVRWDDWEKAINTAKSITPSPERAGKEQGP